MKNLAVVGLGGALGAVARFGLTENVNDGQWPWVTLSINLVGSMLVAIVLLIVRTPLARAFWGAGVLGGFTTLSATSAQARELYAASEPLLATSYIVTSLTACVLGVVVVRLVAGEFFKHSERAYRR